MTPNFYIYIKSFKTHIWIIIALSVLSITLGVMLYNKTTEYNKIKKEEPVSDFEGLEKSEDIKDFRNYGQGYGESTYDKDHGVLLRERDESDIFFAPFLNMYANDWKFSLMMRIFNYGGNYKLIKTVNEDTTIPIYKKFAEMNYCLIDKNSVSIKRTIKDDKYGEAGYTDLYINTYDERTQKEEKVLHSDIFITPLALKYINSTDDTGCLVFFQFIIKGGRNTVYKGTSVNEVIACGGVTEQVILNDFPHLIYQNQKTDLNF